MAVGRESVGWRCVWPEEECWWPPGYPLCSRVQSGAGHGFPCSGQGSCHLPSSLPASFHLHLLFPNPLCPNCSARFSKEHPPSFTLHGAMKLRADFASWLNLQGTFRSPTDPLRALQDPAYNVCGLNYSMPAGDPASYLDEPCIYEVDLYLENGGPWIDPVSKLGYPNWSFFLPGDHWMPGLLPRVRAWIQQQNLGYGYVFVIHPNTGCETRDHFQDLEWYGKLVPLPLSNDFTCNAPGCNQLCVPGTRYTYPGNCSV